MKKSIRKVLSIILVITMIIPGGIAHGETSSNETKENLDKVQVEAQDNTEIISTKEDTNLSEEIKKSIYEIIEVEEVQYYYDEELEEEIVVGYNLLKNKTNDEYEVAYAYSDGNYEFVNSANSYDEAMNIIESTPAVTSNDLVLPVIINKYGQVIYSTSGS